MSLRLIAVDWSGAVSGAQRKIWLAEVDSDDPTVARLEAGRTREEIANHLLELASQTTRLIVGLDFAFSFPAWFLEELGLMDAPALWNRVTEQGEKWLQECRPPFWGRPGTTRPDVLDHFRRTDREVPAIGSVRPKSVFQISGAGTVGTASLRGMPVLQKLRAGGFAVWPFDRVQLPLVVEIYPRVLTGEVNKGNAEERRRYLQANYPELSPDVRETGSVSEDSFDALVSALVMALHADELLTLDPAHDEVSRREGRIWFPLRAARPLRRQHDSSKTRVAPLFNELARQEDHKWIKKLLDLAADPAELDRPWRTKNLSLVAGHWAPNERCLQPPVALLSWLIRNFNPPNESSNGSGEVAAKRKELLAGEPAVIEEALRLLRTAGTKKGWHVLEGPTCPDVLLVTPDALVVIEGKRTEAGATLDTKFMRGRHQILRHLDAAWEIKGRRDVFGMLIVEADDGQGNVPTKWNGARADLISAEVLNSSLPHRSSEEQRQIAATFVGVTTWQAVCREFNIPSTVLLETVGQIR